MNGESFERANDYFTRKSVEETREKDYSVDGIGDSWRERNPVATTLMFMAVYGAVAVGAGVVIGKLVDRF